MKIIQKESDKAIIIIVIYIVFLNAMLIIPGYYTNRYFTSKGIINRLFNDVRNAIFSYYIDNDVYPSNLEELVDGKYIDSYNYTILGKKVIIHYKKLNDSFELECSLNDSGKTFEAKHNNKHNAVFLYILSKVRDKRRVWVRLAHENLFVIYLDRYITEDKFEEFKDYFAIMEKEIQDKFSSEYQIQVTK